MAILLHHGMAALPKGLKKAELVNVSKQRGMYFQSRPHLEIRVEVEKLLAGMVLDCAKVGQGNGRHTIEA
jgi:hypothetical protein